MAYDMTLPHLREILRVGKEKLSDKGVASADKRVAPLRQQTDLPRSAIVAHMVDQFSRRVVVERDRLAADELAEAERRAREQFGAKEWLYYLP
jgi:lipoate-protein ligase A